MQNESCATTPTTSTIPCSTRSLTKMTGAIFFEGTYSDFFAAGGPLTPRYNYNQFMYRLDLADPLAGAACTGV